jgi:hypothetical protein
MMTERAIEGILDRTLDADSTLDADQMRRVIASPTCLVDEILVEQPRCE